MKDFNPHILKLVIIKSNIRRKYCCKKGENQNMNGLSIEHKM